MFFTAVVFIMLWFFQIVFLENFYEKMKISDVKLSAKKIVDEYGDDDYGRTLTTIAISNDLCIEIVDKYGRVIYTKDTLGKSCLIHSPDSMKGEFLNKLKESGKKEIYFKEYNSAISNDMLVFAVVIGSADSPEGYVLINTPLVPVGSTASIIKRQLLIITIYLIILSIVISFFMARKIAEPIVKITKSAEKMAAGNYSIKFEGGDYLEIQRLASEAPGTFNHSLVVGNLAEACASAIGENPNMARCAAYYHDIGKLKAPIYFSENQSSYNPHDELIPEVSVSMITSHTLFGEILAKQNRLPKEIVAICREHHGTSPVGYFYRKALTLKEEGDLAVDKYTYAGPKPQTKIAAIIMIADTIEAAMRAYMPDTKEEFEARINKLVDEKMELRQFDECPITMGDIAVIKRTIIEVLPSIHHSRVSYEKKRSANTFNK